MGVLIMKGGIGISVVPLLAIGTGQASNAARTCRNVDSYHIDELNRDEKVSLLAKIVTLDSRNGRPIMIFVSPQSLDDPAMKSTIKRLVSSGTLSTVCIDEMHRVPLDAGRPGAFRPEFARLKINLFDLLASSERPIAVIGMTATITAKLLAEFNSITGITFDTTFWGDVGRRNITMRLVFAHQTVVPLKLLVSKHRAEAKKIILYSNHSNRMANLSKAVSKALGAGEDACTLHGETGSAMKFYAIEAFSAHEGNARFEHINAVVLIGTSAANCGIDSPSCGAVGREGPPAHIVDLEQERGRIRACDTTYNYEYLICMSVPAWCKLLLRISESGDAEERRRQQNDLMEVLKLLVLPSSCIHVALERAFGCPGSIDAAPCVNKCWYCDPNLGLGRDAKVVRAEIERVLRSNFLRGSTTSDAVVCALHAGRVAIWGDSKTTKNHAARLTLQLIAAGIIQFSVDRPSGTAILNWGIGALDLAYTEAERWASIATQ